MIINRDWKYIKKEDQEKAQFIKDCSLNDEWWDKVDYLLDFTEPIINMLRIADTGMLIMHLVYGMWDSMIKYVKVRVFQHENNDLLIGDSRFFEVVHEIFVSRWNARALFLYM